MRQVVVIQVPSNGGDNTTELDAMIKPNITSWRGINVSNAFNVSLKMNDSSNRYGFNNTTDTHMMKNSEWGVVAYLSQSKYGKLGNTDFSGANKEIYQNKSSQFITGCSYGSPSNGNTDYGCQYTYDININGTGASTTGNIYGIYDMSGGGFEYVMSNYNDIVALSGFILMPESKYYNKYTSDDMSIACNGNECLSHGLTEVRWWYNDGHTFSNEEYPWIARGGSYSDNVGSGIFYFQPFITGGQHEYAPFRLVATIR